MSNPEPESFSVEFDPADEMDVRDFAKALLALDKLVNEVNRAVNPGSPRVSLKISSIAKTGPGEK